MIDAGKSMIYNVFMKTLWFKSEFVTPILSGEKRDTIRPESTRLPHVGDTVAFSVGPRPPFAQATIVRIESVKVDELPESRHRALARCAIDARKPLVRLTFSLKETARLLVAPLPAQRRQTPRTACRRIVRC